MDVSDQEFYLALGIFALFASVIALRGWRESRKDRRDEDRWRFW
jgi:hypothetical protein